MLVANPMLVFLASTPSRSGETGWASFLPVTDQTLVFLIVMLVILLAPMLFARLRIPHIIGMILAGVLIGEHGLGLLSRDASFELLGQAGIYYIMFLAGLEMDAEGLRHNRKRGVIFGAWSSLLPFAGGWASGYWLLGTCWQSALLLACVLASHTLVSYPVVSRYQLGKHRSVTISVAATMFALLFALTVLAALAGGAQGRADVWFWLWFVGKLALFVAALFVIFPRVIRLFFRSVTDGTLQFVFVLCMMFAAAETAVLCGLEGILGAFLSGLVFNRYIPKSTPLMNRVEFMGNAFFIPYFLIGVGMLVNLAPLLTSRGAQAVVVVMVVAGTLTKYIAAVVARRSFRMSRASGLMMFGLTEAHAAGALAMVMVGTKLEVAPGVLLMDTSMLDGVVVMILLSCIISTMVTDQAARMLKMEGETGVEPASGAEASDDEKIMVLVNDPNTIPNLVHTALMMRNSLLHRGIICLSVVNDDDPTGVLTRHSDECLRLAEDICLSADAKVQTQRRLAVNFVNGTIHALRENDASELVIGMHRKRSPKDSSLGRFIPPLVNGMLRQICIVDFHIPVNTFRRIIVAVPPKAHYESGFYRWVERVTRLSIEIGCRICFHAEEQTAELIRAYENQCHPLVRDEYRICDDDNRQENLTALLAEDHLLVIVAARRGTLSYEKRMAQLTRHLSEQLPHISRLIIFPDQEGEGQALTVSFSAPHGQEIRQSAVTRWLSKWIRKMG